MRRFWATLSLLVLGISGCAAVDATKSMWTSMKPRPSEDDGTKGKGDWDWVGKQGRGDRPIEYENDPLKKWLYSDKALEIERNLGVGE